MAPSTAISIPYISDVLLRAQASQAVQLATRALGDTKLVHGIVGNLANQDSRDDVELGKLYDEVDNLRVNTRNAQNYVDRALALSHPFVPMIEGAYACPGSERALQKAHRLHLSIGLAKDVIGGGGVGTNEKGKAAAQSGASDKLAVLERKIGDLARRAPAGLHRIPLDGEVPSEAAVEDQAAGLEESGCPDPLVLTFALLPRRRLRSRRRRGFL